MLISKSLARGACSPRGAVGNSGAEVSIALGHSAELHFAYSCIVLPRQLAPQEAFPENKMMQVFSKHGYFLCIILFNVLTLPRK